MFDGLPAFNNLEQMAGANKWHERARFVFALEKGLDFDTVEADLHTGHQVASGQQESPVFGTRKLALDLYREYEVRVKEVGEGDVSEYAKKASGLSRKQIDQRMQEYFKSNK